MVSIRSFLIHARPGCRDALVAALRREPDCDVYPSISGDVVVIVAEHTSRADEDAFDERLARRPEVANVARVSGVLDRQVVES